MQPKYSVSVNDIIVFMVLLYRAAEFLSSE